MVLFGGFEKEFFGLCNGFLGCVQGMGLPKEGFSAALPATASPNLNEDFKQLLLSTRVYLYQGGAMVPINVKTANLQYKTRQKERLINYEIEFAYSYNEINNV